MFVKDWDLTRWCRAICWIIAKNAFEIQGQNLGVYQTQILCDFQKTDPIFVKTMQTFSAVFAKRSIEPCNSSVLCTLEFSGSISGTCHKLGCSRTRARGLEKMPWEHVHLWQATLPHNSVLISRGMGFQELCQSDFIGLGHFKSLMSRSWVSMVSFERPHNTTYFMVLGVSLLEGWRTKT